MENIVDVKWKGDMAFEADVNGFKINMDADEEFGGKNFGPKPKPFMLVALAGCTGMDVISILKKMKVDVIDLNIKVIGNLTENHPKYYDSMKIVYEFIGNNLDEKKLKKAVTLSQENYCGVSAFYKKVIEVPTEIKILDL